jgi:predicted nucleotidyltransferase
MTDVRALLRLLSEAGVEYIVIGGVAATAHGSARATLDLDIVYRRTAANIGRLVRALAPCRPYLRGAPPGLPFRWDAATIQRGLNFTLTTTVGDLDVLGEIVGGGDYDALLASTQLVPAFGVECRLLDLDRLIEVKRAAGRPKDFEAIAELETIRERRQDSPP